MQIAVRFVTARSTKHKHYIVTCLSGVCQVLVTITVTTDSYTRETLCFTPLVSDWSHISVRSVSDSVTAQSTRHGVRSASGHRQIGVKTALCLDVDAMNEENPNRTFATRISPDRKSTTDGP